MRVKFPNSECWLPDDKVARFELFKPFKDTHDWIDVPIYEAEFIPLIENELKYDITDVKSVEE